MHITVTVLKNHDNISIRNRESWGYELSVTLLANGNSQVLKCSHYP